MALSSSGRRSTEAELRNPLADYLKAVNEQIATRESVGASPTPYLLQQKAELEAALGIVREGELEHAADVTVLETAVPAPPRRPGRPRRVDG